MAFITKSVFNRLQNSKVTMYSNVSIELFQEIERNFRVSQVLTDLDYNKLNNYVQINSNSFSNGYVGNYLLPRMDTYSYVFENPTAYKYHLFDDCPYLSSDFFNYIVPDDVKNLGSNIVEEFRKWFLENGFDKIIADEKEIVAKMTFKYNTSFARKYQLPPLNESYKLFIHVQNTTYVLKEKYYRYSDIKTNIHNYIKEFNLRFQGTGSVLKKMMLYSYMVNQPRFKIEEMVSDIASDVFIKNYGYEKLLDDFRFANSIRYKVVSQLKIYINWMCNFKPNNLSAQVLERYGLECCKSCYERDLANSNKV